MKKEPDMKAHPSLFTPAALSVAIAIALSALPGSPANAQTTITATSTAATSTSSTTTSTSTTALVAITGIVSGSPESVSFSGQAKVSTKAVTDPDFGNPPSVVISIDLSGVTGVGSSTKKKYVISNQEILTRKLTAADTLQMTFPFYLSTSSALASNSVGMASFNLSFDMVTMRLTGASGAIASPQ
jgi:hypothetical protein